MREGTLSWRFHFRPRHYIACFSVTEKDAILALEARPPHRRRQCRRHCRQPAIESRISRSLGTGEKASREDLPKRVVTSDSKPNEGCMQTSLKKESVHTHASLSSNLEGGERAPIDRSKASVQRD
jgi:hypothetical protein